MVSKDLRTRKQIYSNDEFAAGEDKAPINASNWIHKGYNSSLNHYFCKYNENGDKEDNDENNDNEDNKERGNKNNDDDNDDSDDNKEDQDGRDKEDRS